MDELAKRYGFKHLLSSPGHPETNGRVERLNGTLKEKLWKIMATSKNSWDVCLNAATAAYNMSPHSQLGGRSPYEVFHSRIPKMIGNEAHIPVNVADATSEVLEKALDSFQRQVQESNQLPRPDDLQVGQEVLIDNLNRAKHEPRWVGPWTIVGKNDSGQYELVSRDGSRRVINRKSIRTWTPPEEDSPGGGEDCRVFDAS